MSAPDNLKIYVGLHQPSDARHFELAFLSVNRLRGRKKSCWRARMDHG